MLYNSLNIIRVFKKKTNITDECSVINPLTSSDSASAKSNGALLASNKNVIITRPNIPIKVNRT